MSPNTKVFKKILAILLFSASWPVDTTAHPVIYKGGYVTSVMLHPDYSHLHANYSITSRYAIGLNYESFRRHDAAQERPKEEYYYFQGNVLLKRFFQDDSQGNIYVKFGAGQRQQDSQKIYYSGFQADWETRTIFTAASSDTLFSPDTITEQRHNIRFGISPYEARYDEMQTWLILQIEHQRNDEEMLRLTPLMRFFYKTSLWELGADLDGNWLMHFMIHI